MARSPMDKTTISRLSCHEEQILLISKQIVRAWPYDSDGRLKILHIRAILARAGRQLRYHVLYLRLKRLQYGN